MTDKIEKTGKSVEEAINLALEELNCGREDAEIEILAEPAKGLWGILGTKEARIRAWRKEDGPGEAADGLGGSDMGDGLGAAPEADDKTAKFIREVTGLMGIEANIGKKESEEAILYTLNGPRMGAVIGRRGETLDALQYLSNIVAGRDKDIPRKRIIVDAEDYRQRREDTLIRLATRLATKAKRSGRRVVLEPMNPQERRVIHTALEKDPDVRSLSEGEEPYRRLVIYPNNVVERSGGGDRGERSDRGDGGRRYNRGGGGRYDRGDGDRSGGERSGGERRYSWGMDDGDSADGSFDSDDE